MALNLFIAALIAALIGGSTVTLLNQFLQGNHFITHYQLTLVFISYFLATLITSFIQQVLQRKQRRGSRATPQMHAHSAERTQGVVKWFNVNKGFGFITQENGDDIFVHYRSIRGQGHKKLVEDQRVSYVIINSERGLQADDVEILD